MSNSKFTVEIHDRDFKYEKELVARNANLLDAGLIAPNLNPKNSYGVAQFGNLSFNCRLKRSA